MQKERFDDVKLLHLKQDFFFHFCFGKVPEMCFKTSGTPFGWYWVAVREPSGRGLYLMLQSISVAGAAYFHKAVKPLCKQMSSVFVIFFSSKLYFNLKVKSV